MSSALPIFVGITQPLQGLGQREAAFLRRTAADPVSHTLNSTTTKILTLTFEGPATVDAEPSEGISSLISWEVVRVQAKDELADVEVRAAELRAAQSAEQAARRALAAAIGVAAGAGSPQRLIAERAGVSQPYISQVLAATPPKPRFTPRSPLGRRLLAKRADVLRVVRSYGADNVVVFGSVAAGTDKAGSDVDLMVDIPAGMGLFTLGRMEQELRDVLAADVDLIPSRLAKPQVLASAAEVAVPL